MMYEFLNCMTLSRKLVLIYMSVIDIKIETISPLLFFRFSIVPTVSPSAFSKRTTLCLSPETQNVAFLLLKWRFLALNSSLCSRGFCEADIACADLLWRHPLRWNLRRIQSWICVTGLRSACLRNSSTPVLSCSRLRRKSSPPGLSGRRVNLRNR